MKVAIIWISSRTLNPEAEIAIHARPRQITLEIPFVAVLHYRDYLSISKLAGARRVGAIYELGTASEGVVIIKGAMRYSKIVPLTDCKSTTRNDETGEHNPQNLAPQHYRLQPLEECFSYNV